MSVHFTSISTENPVTVDHVRTTLLRIGVQVSPKDEADYTKLLAACHDIAVAVSEMDDYSPPTDLARFPRIKVHRVKDSEQVLGNAWCHTMSIRDASIRGLLTGKTVCLKDCIAVAGVPQLLGTKSIEPWTPTSDATVVRWALEAGAEIVGTTNCESWCQSTSSFSSDYGVVDNPYAGGYSAGGSTSGAAALVGAGLVDIAIGADQGGSIRVPAALCGCVGMKPTFGLVPYTGIVSNDAVDDHAGPVSRTVMDTALCLDAISGDDGIDDRCAGSLRHGSTSFAADLSAPTSTNLSGFKVGILKEAFDEAIVDPGMRAAVLAAAARFKDLGATVTEVSVPDHRFGTAAWTIQQRISGSQTLLGQAHGRRGYGLTGLETARLPWTQEKFDRCFPTTQNTMLNGLYLSENFPGLYGKALNLGRRLRDAYERVLETCDVLILPTVSFVAPKHGERSTPIATSAPTVGLTANTAVFDTTGQPAMTIPVGWLPAKEDPDVRLPVGMQIVSGMWKDSKVLRAGHGWESKFNWKTMEFPEAGR
ncbi:Amidase [Cladophialophora carrionii]|uniref:Amidase n=1 Tax=Cladophialophora carrionii TaxID=86049 RepID=A0A1C1C677_9EURO|nr:Amidase [Cladophialophora carrionii]